MLSAATESSSTKIASSHAALNGHTHHSPLVSNRHQSLSASASNSAPTHSTSSSSVSDASFENVEVHVYEDNEIYEQGQHFGHEQHYTESGFMDAEDAGTIAPHLTMHERHVVDLHASSNATAMPPSLTSAALSTSASSSSASTGFAASSSANSALPAPDQIVRLPSHELRKQKQHMQRQSSRSTSSSAAASSVRRVRRSSSEDMSLIRCLRWKSICKRWLFLKSSLPTAPSSRSASLSSSSSSSSSNHLSSSSPDLFSSGASPAMNSISLNSSGTSASADSSSGSCFSWWMLARFLIFIILVLLVLLSVLFWSELKSAFVDCLVWVQGLSFFYGALALTIANLVGALLALPCLPFTLGAGFLYGTMWGSIIITIACNIASIISFLCARYLARQIIEKTLSTKGSKIRMLDQAINQDGFKIVFLVRSSPIHPYGLCNYLFGLTSVTLRDYALATFLGMTPSIITEVYFGTAMADLADILKGDLDSSLESRIFFWTGLLVTIIVTIVITVWLKEKLKIELNKHRRRMADTEEGEIEMEEKAALRSLDEYDESLNAISQEQDLEVDNDEDFENDEKAERMPMTVLGQKNLKRKELNKKAQKSESYFRFMNDRSKDGEMLQRTNSANAAVTALPPLPTAGKLVTVAGSAVSMSGHPDSPMLPSSLLQSLKEPPSVSPDIHQSYRMMDAQAYSNYYYANSKQPNASGLIDEEIQTHGANGESMMSHTQTLQAVNVSEQAKRRAVPLSQSLSANANDSVAVAPASASDGAGNGIVENDSDNGKDNEIRHAMKSVHTKKLKKKGLNGHVLPNAQPTPTVAS